MYCYFCSPLLIQNLNMDAEEETEHLFLPTTTNYSETSQKTETKSLDEQSHMSLSPMLSRGKRNNSHFSNDLQLLIRDSYDGKGSFIRDLCKLCLSRSRGNRRALHCSSCFSLSDGPPATTDPVSNYKLGKPLTQ